MNNHLSSAQTSVPHHIQQNTDVSTTAHNIYYQNAQIVDGINPGSAMLPPTDQRQHIQAQQQHYHNQVMRGGLPATISLPPGSTINPDIRTASTMFYNLHIAAPNYGHLMYPQPFHLAAVAPQQFTQIPQQQQLVMQPHQYQQLPPMMNQQMINVSTAPTSHQQQLPTPQPSQQAPPVKQSKRILNIEDPNTHQKLDLGSAAFKSDTRPSAPQDDPKALSAKQSLWQRVAEVAMPPDSKGNLDPSTGGVPTATTTISTANCVLPSLVGSQDIDLPDHMSHIRIEPIADPNIHPSSPTLSIDTQRTNEEAVAATTESTAPRIELGSLLTGADPSHVFECKSALNSLSASEIDSPGLKHYSAHVVMPSPRLIHAPKLKYPNPCSPSIVMGLRRSSRTRLPRLITELGQRALYSKPDADGNRTLLGAQPLVVNRRNAPLLVKHRVLDPVLAMDKQRSLQRRMKLMRKCRAEKRSQLNDALPTIEE